MTTTGGPDVLVPVTLPDPEPGPGELLVDVAAAGVNFIDTYQRRTRCTTPRGPTRTSKGGGRPARSC